MSKTGFYQRDYNIINFEASRLHQKASVLREPQLPRISHNSKTFDKNYSTISLSDNPTWKNTYSFENVIRDMKEKKKYDPLLESKINNNTRYDNTTCKSTINASKLDYDFISFAKKSPEGTFQALKGGDPKAIHKKSVVSEFIHLNRVTSPNINPNYQNIIVKDNKAFRLKDGMGCQYLDSKKTYGEIGQCFKRAGK